MKILAGLLLLMLELAPAIAADEAKPSAKNIIFNATSERDDGKIITAALPAPHSGYATVRYSIGTAAQKPRLRDLITTIAHALPEKMGNSEGTYTVTLTITDQAGNLLVKEPILSFQWTRERGFLFVDNVVTDAQKTSWSGTLINQLPITESNQVLKFSIEVFAQKGRSIDFDLLKKTAKTFSDGALAALFPLPAAAMPIISSVTDLISSFYTNATKKVLVDQDDLPLEVTKTPIRAPISFEDFEKIPVLISVTTMPTRLAGDIFANGKFGSKPDESIFNNASMVVGNSKQVSIVELITTSTEAKLKNTRAMLDVVLPGGTYGNDPTNKKEGNIATLCGNLYDALNIYLSKYDARAMFFAFITRYGDNLNRAACIGSRNAPLAEVGLALP
ncbi:MAG: hypothetical protein M9932_09615 [Xanthobacteraceae bacterium]|nr:hypothetical protein [Xanthobacteraceae bacterium]